MGATILMHLGARVLPEPFRPHGCRFRHRAATASDIRRTRVAFLRTGPPQRGAFAECQAAPARALFAKGGGRSVGRAAERRPTSTNDETA